MPPAAYDDYFCTPWATDREDEAKHRELTKSIGESLRGKIDKTCLYFLVVAVSFPGNKVTLFSLDLDYTAYLLLYGMTLYNISQQALDQLEIIQKDRQILRKVR